VDTIEPPSPPTLDDPKALAAWTDALIAMSYERGERLWQDGLREGEARGREDGLREGEARGREMGPHEGELRAQARAVVEVLRRRGVALSDEQAERLLACRDASTLARWWDLAWAVGSAEELGWS
jgi:hypothetical protein